MLKNIDINPTPDHEDETPYGTIDPPVPESATKTLARTFSRVVNNPWVRRAAVGVVGAFVYTVVMEKKGYRMVQPLQVGEEVVFKGTDGNLYEVQFEDEPVDAE